MFLPTFTIALQAMRKNKMRAGLTILGMVIGVASIVIVFSAGEGVKSLIVWQIESFGTDIIETEIKAPTSKKTSNLWHEGGMAVAQGVQITSLTLRDLEKINRVNNVVASYASIMGQEQASYGNELRKAFLYGTTASYLDIDRGEVEFWRFFSDAEDRSLAKVIVLWPKMKTKLFGDSDALGKSVKIHKSKYRVIGVMKIRGATMGMDFDDFIYIPIRTLQKRILGIDYVLYMIHQIKDLSLAAETAAEIRSVLRESHNITVQNPDDYYKDDFRVVTMTEMMSTLDTVTNALTLLLLAIVTVSLIVGGVGIMNIMYVVVSERTAEIGLRKAVWANFGQIMWQFLTESVLISCLGAFIGIFCGVGLSFLIATLAQNYGFDWKFIIPQQAIIIALLFSLFTGLVFGLYPARKAAKLDPIEALRR